MSGEGTAAPADIPGYNGLLNALVTWGRSGFIPNTKIIRSYYQPTIDPTVGVPVTVPATVYARGVIPNYVKANYVPVDSLPAAPSTGSVIQDYNLPPIKMAAKTEPPIPKTELAIITVRNGSRFKEAALTSKSESEYIQRTKNLGTNSILERASECLAYNPQKITDKFSDAKPFCSIQSEIPENTLRIAEIPKRYDMIPTGVPVAIPGVINCYPVAYDDFNYRKVEYKYKNPYLVVSHVPEQYLRVPGTDITVGGTNQTQVLIGGDFRYATPQDTNNIPDNPTDYPGDI